MTMKLKIAIVLLAASAHCAWADGLKSLETFMRDVRSGRASFTQTVTPPPKDGQAARSKQSSGDFAFARPGRFRFDYTKPFAQTIVADGKTLWLYDPDLNQVTQRAQQQALGSTPAALLTSAADLAALRAEFVLENAPDQDGLQWVLARPKAPGGQLQSVRVGFAGAQLAVLDIEDSFGQRSQIRFTGLQSNPSLPAATFHFQVPAGAEVQKLGVDAHP
jgi:outer membrane lipoprotein carrier protein